jgi:hypothetical protein
MKTLPSQENFRLNPLEKQQLIQDIENLCSIKSISEIKEKLQHLKKDIESC